jgi:hypothetical protein
MLRFTLLPWIKINYLLLVSCLTYLGFQQTLSLRYCNSHVTVHTPISNYNFLNILKDFNQILYECVIKRPLKKYVFLMT